MKDKLNLNVEIDKHSGFCFGVIGAIRKAEEILDREGHLYCLGEIVHNEEEINRLEKKGLITITREQLSGLHHQKIMFRAHGEPPSSYELARRNGNEIIDASCPIILMLHERIRATYENGESIYIFGKRDHPEIIGLLGEIGNHAVVFESREELDLTTIPRRIALYSQTTRNLEAFKQIVDYLRSSGITVNVKDTICRQVAGRQPKLREFCRSYDKIIFIAGKHSSNGRVLFEVCLEQNPLAYYVNSKKEIDPSWFNPGDHVGISGGTSTPMWLMEEIRKVLLSF